MVWKCPACGFDQNDESYMVCVCGFRYVPEIAYQENITDAITTIKVRAGFRRLAVFLWTGFMTSFCIAMTYLAVIKVTAGQSLFFFIIVLMVCPILFFAYLKACLSVFAGDITIYPDKILQHGLILRNEFRLQQTYIIDTNHKFFGGRVLQLIEENANNVFSRFKALFLFKRSIIIYLWMLSEEEEQKVLSELSKISGWPETELRQSSCIVKPFYSTQRC